MTEPKSVDVAQVKLDKQRGAASAGNAAAGMGGLIFKVVAVLFVIGNVTALYVLHFVNRPSPTTRFTFSNFEAVNGTSATVGNVVSLSAESKLRNGAGTTAYLNRATLNDADVTYYEYINVAKLGTTSSNYLTNLMSYRRVGANSKQSVLTSFTVDLSTRAVSISTDYDKTANVIANFAIRDIATLSDTSALVMTVDDRTWTYQTYVTAASISAKSGATLATSTQKLVATGSATQYMTRLDSSTAIIAYYDAYVDSSTSYYQNVVAATVGSDGTVSLSSPKTFGPDNLQNMADWGRPVTTSSADGSFAIPYHQKDSGLCLAAATYSTSAKTFSNFTETCNTNFQPTFYPEGIMLSDNIMLIAFHDGSRKNMLTLVTASVSGTKVYFRSSYTFPDVAGDYDSDYGYISPDVSLAMLSGNRLAVSFLNPAMNGRQSVKIVRYSIESLSFKDVTPVVPVAASTFTLSLNGATTNNRAVTQRIMAVGSDSVVAIHLGARGAASYQHVALVEAFGAPVGVLRDLNGKHKASVAISGKASDVNTKGNGDLVSGRFYYATTAGYVASPASGTATGAEVFATSEDANMLVTADGKVGLATDANELFVSTAF